MRPQGRIERLASGSHGVVTREQLLAAGLTVGQIKSRLRSGELLQEYRGVYRVGHRAPSVEARHLAAVWACGRGALLSGRAAGHLLGILTTPPYMPEVTAPTERRIPGIKTHRSRSPVDAAVWRGIPVTTPARTLVDLSSVLAVADLARACTRRASGTAPRRVTSRRSWAGGAGLEAAPRAPRGRTRLAERARAPLRCAVARRRAAATDDQPAGRRPVR